MAFVVLLTTMSLTVNMHYCGDTMVDFAFFKNAQSCGMEKVKETSNCENPNLSRKSCCSDKQLVIQGQDELKLALDTLNFEQQSFVSALIYSYACLFETSDEDITTYKEYRPPLVRQNILVLHQTFLI